MPYWLWCFCNTNCTYYLIDDNRGGDALRKFFVDAFDGTLVTDFRGAYESVMAADYQKCNPHLLRELIKVDEYNVSSEWKAFSKQLNRLIRDGIRLRKRHDFDPQKYKSRIHLIHRRLCALADAEYVDADTRIRNREVLGEFVQNHPSEKTGSLRADGWASASPENAPSIKSAVTIIQERNGQPSISNPRNSMPQNIEVKLKVDDLETVKRSAIAQGAREVILLTQRDTFYHCSSGRLKLREIENDHAELIAYARTDEPAVRFSDYSLMIVDDPTALNALLTRSLGVRGVVEKRRELLLWRNVRIHLDRVESLGDFVELESVVGEVDAAAASQNLQVLLELLELGHARIVPKAYVDLLIEP